MDLFQASRVGSIVEIQRLLEESTATNVNSKFGEDQEAALHGAAQDGHLEIVQYLLAKGADVNIKNASGLSPLHLACQNGHLAVTKELLDAGADIESTDQDGWKPLHSAAESGRVPAIQLLIEKGANLNVQLSDGATPLHTAALSSQMDAAAELLRAGADPNVTMDKEGSALHIACLQGHTPTVQALLEGGMDPDMLTEDGWTSLHVACYYGNVEVVFLLLAHGIDPETKGNVCQRPAECFADFVDDQTQERLKGALNQFLSPHMAGYWRQRYREEQMKVVQTARRILAVEQDFKATVKGVEKRLAKENALLVEKLKDAKIRALNATANIKKQEEHPEIKRLTEELQKEKELNNKLRQQMDSEVKRLQEQNQKTLEAITKEWQQLKDQVEKAEMENTKLREQIANANSGAPEKSIIALRSEVEYLNSQLEEERAHKEVSGLEGIEEQMKNGANQVILRKMDKEIEKLKSEIQVQKANHIQEMIRMSSELVETRQAAEAKNQKFKQLNIATMKWQIHQLKQLNIVMMKRIQSTSAPSAVTDKDQDCSSEEGKATPLPPDTFLPNAKKLETLATEDVCYLLEQLQLGQFTEQVRGQDIDGAKLKAMEPFLIANSIGMKPYLRAIAVEKILQMRQRGVPEFSTCANFKSEDCSIM